MTNKELREKLETYFAKGMKPKAILTAWPECPLDNQQIKHRRKRWLKKQTPQNTDILAQENLDAPKSPPDEAVPVEVAIAAPEDGAPEDELAKYRAKRQAQAVGMPSDNETVKDLPPGSAVVIFQHLLDAPTVGTLKQFVWTDIIATSDVKTRASLYNTYLRTLMAETQIGGGAVGTGAGDGTGDPTTGATTYLDGDTGEVEVLTDDQRNDMIAEMIRMGEERLGIQA